MPVVAGLVLRSQVARVTDDPMHEFCPATSVRTGVYRGLVEFRIIAAVLEKRYLRVVQVEGG
jgi:hypothetical protein